MTAVAPGFKGIPEDSELSDDDYTPLYDDGDEPEYERIFF